MLYSALHLMHYLWFNFTIYYSTQGSRFELRRGGAEADWLRVCDVFIEVTFSGPDLFQILSIRTLRHHRDIVCSLWSINPDHDDRRSSTDLRRLSCRRQHELSTIDGIQLWDETLFIVHILSGSKRNDLKADKSFWNLYQWFSAANVERQDHNTAWHLAW